MSAGVRHGKSQQVPLPQRQPAGALSAPKRPVRGEGTGREILGRKLQTVNAASASSPFPIQAHPAPTRPNKRCAHAKAELVRQPRLETYRRYFVTVFRNTDRVCIIRTCPRGSRPDRPTLI